MEDDDVKFINFFNISSTEDSFTESEDEEYILSEDERNWLDDQLDLLAKTEAGEEPTMEDMWDDMDWFVEENEGNKELDMYLYDFECNKIDGLNVAIAEEETYGWHSSHLFAYNIGPMFEYYSLDKYTEIQAVNELAQSRIPFGNEYMHVQNDEREIAFCRNPFADPDSEEVDALLLAMRNAGTLLQYDLVLQPAYKGLQKFHFNWSDTNAEGDTSDIPLLAPSVPVYVPEPIGRPNIRYSNAPNRQTVPPPPGFTIGDRNEDMNRLSFKFEDYLAQCKRRRALSPDAIPVFKKDTPEKRIVQNIWKLEDASFLSEFKKPKERCSEALDSKNSSSVWGLRNKQLVEIPKFRTELVWNYTNIGVTPAVAASEAHVETLQNRICLSPNLDEFPTLNQVYGCTERVSTNKPHCKSPNLDDFPTLDEVYGSNERVNSNTQPKVSSKKLSSGHHTLEIASKSAACASISIDKIAKTACDIVTTESENSEAILSKNYEESEPVATKLNAEDTLFQLFSLRPKSNTIFGGSKVNVSEVQESVEGKGRNAAIFPIGGRNAAVFPVVLRDLSQEGSVKELQGKSIFPTIPTMMDVDVAGCKVPPCCIKPIAKLPSLMDIEVHHPCSSNPYVSDSAVTSKSSATSDSLLVQSKEVSSESKDILMPKSKSPDQKQKPVLVSSVAHPQVGHTPKIDTELIVVSNSNAETIAASDVNDDLKEADTNIEEDENKAALKLKVFSRVFADPPRFRQSEPVLLVQPQMYVRAQQSKNIRLGGNRGSIIFASGGTVELRTTIRIMELRESEPLMNLGNELEPLVGIEGTESEDGFAGNICGCVKASFKQRI